MTRPGKKVEKLKIEVKPVKDWKALDFANYFASQYKRNYPDLPEYKIIFAKDCSIIKRIISKFDKHNRAKPTVVRFIDWVFEQYKARPDFTTPLTIGFLESWMEEFLGIKFEEPKKSKEKKVKYSEETQKWLEEQRKIYKARMNK